MNKTIFGYRKVSETSAISAYLFEEGNFLVRKSGSRGENSTVFQVSEDCVQEITNILARHKEDLKQYARVINEQADVENENYYIFGDHKIIDWDRDRFKLEEERQKGPSYYKNAMKVELTEGYVRKIFNEICQVIEQDEKEVRHMRFFI